MQWFSLNSPKVKVYLYSKQKSVNEMTYSARKPAIYVLQNWSVLYACVN
jgi:hypothetical protein